MRRLDHPNIVQLKYFFFSSGDKVNSKFSFRFKIFVLFVFIFQLKEEVYLNLVLEFIPETAYRVARHYTKQKQTIPIIYVKVNFALKTPRKLISILSSSITYFQLYMYQLFRALAYIHSFGICHRDIKPQNLLLDPESSVLKLCDFGRFVHDKANAKKNCMVSF